MYIKRRNRRNVQRWFQHHRRLLLLWEEEQIDNDTEKLNNTTKTGSALNLNRRLSNMIIFSPYIVWHSIAISEAKKLRTLGKPFTPSAPPLIGRLTLDSISCTRFWILRPKERCYVACCVWRLDNCSSTKEYCVAWAAHSSRHPNYRLSGLIISGTSREVLLVSVGET